MLEYDGTILNSFYRKIAILPSLSWEGDQVGTTWLLPEIECDITENIVFLVTVRFSGGVFCMVFYYSLRNIPKVTH